MENIYVNISRAYPRETKRLRILLLLTTFLLGMGIVSPIITLKKFVLIENTFSVLSGTIELLKEGKLFVFILIAGFSLVIPLLKLGVLYKLLSDKAGKVEYLDKCLRWMNMYGKWSMLDVFVVAVLVVAVKLGAIASVEMRFGLYSFASAVVLTMYVTARVVSLSDGSKGEAKKSGAS